MDEVEAKVEWLDELSDVNVNVTMGSILLSYMLYRCRIAFTNDLDTAGALVTASENIIYFNPDFFMKELKDTKERAFVMLHEVLHIFLQHGERAKDHPGLNLSVWNAATDYNINLTCAGDFIQNNSVRRSEKYKRYFKMPSIGGLYDQKYIGMTSEEIYNLLIESANESPGNFDTHFQSEGDTSRQLLKNKEAMISAVIVAEQSKSIGDSEDSLVKQIKQIAKPKVDWREFISASISSLGYEHMTYSRLSRRSQGRVKFPTYISETIRIVFGVDSSGSMSDNDYSRVRGELFGIMNQFDNWEIRIVSCDTKIHELGKFTKEDGHSFEDACVNFIGGGGTSLYPIVKYANQLKEEDEYVDACLILTDGYIPEDIQNDFDSEIENIVLVTEGGNKTLKLENCKIINIEG